MTFRTWLHRNAVTLEALYVALVVGMVLGALALYRAGRDAEGAAPVEGVKAVGTRP
jgi:hypothetical protein